MEVNFEGLMEQLWDEFSYHVEDDIDSLTYVAGRAVITENDFKKLVKKLSALLNSEQSVQGSDTTGSEKSDEAGNIKPSNPTNQTKEE